MTHLIDAGIRARPLCVISTFLAVLSLGGCGGGSSTPSVPPPPSSVLTLALSETKVPESGEIQVRVTMSVSPVSRTAIGATLAFQGTARNKIDFEVDTERLVIASGESSTTTRIVSLPDWVKEEDKTLNVILTNPTPNARLGTPRSATLTITDSGNLTVDRTTTDFRPRAIADINVFSDRVSFSTLVINLGLRATPDLAYRIRLTTDDRGRRPYIHTLRGDLPSVGPRRSLRDESVLLLKDIEPTPNGTYYAFVDVLDRETRSVYASDRTGFKVGIDAEPIARCIFERANNPTSGPDPLLSSQWNLRNVGQKVFGAQGGQSGEDLRMANVLATNHVTGKGVNVSVVDTGLEICHPDLVANIAEGRSFNGVVDSDRVDGHDPFNPSVMGDHGTSVAGLIAATANNGIGGRGVAPEVSLRGTNFLGRYSYVTYEDALGHGSGEAHSRDVDIFNMSFGTYGLWVFNAPEYRRNLFASAIQNLRQGLGPLYVKAAGNSFRSCYNVSHDIHRRIGCNSSTADATGNLPYVINIGGFNAAGYRASYSSVGSNLWVVAPAGEFGVSEPANVSTDQFGPDRGYWNLHRRGLAPGDSGNPMGDYISTMNGTSAATPNAAGAMALLLEAHPNFTWRDVKHTLASTARRIFIDHEPEEVVFGSTKVQLRRAWQRNAANYWFNNWFGFGAIDVDAALAFAQRHRPDSLGEFVESEWFLREDEDAIPDNDGIGLSQIQRISVDNRSAAIEAVQVQVRIEHGFMPEISIQLTSPSGTTSILSPVYNNVLAAQPTIDWLLLSNAFYGETPNGLWVLTVIDHATGEVGLLQSWQLKVFYGEHP